MSPFLWEGLFSVEEIRNMSDVFLDPQIRDNAMVAIFFVFLCSNIIRQNLFALLKDEPQIDLSQLKHNNVLARARQLRSGAGKFLMEDAFKNRRTYFCKKDTGVLEKAPETKSAMEQMEHQDPAQAMGMMKTQMIFLFSQGAIGYWVNFLFTGFLVGKTPFPLTYRFKSMLQRGVEVDNLEPGYISGLCWYMILMMCVGQIQQLLMNLVEGEQKATTGSSGGEDPMMMMMGVQQPANPLMGGPDMKKLYGAEKEQLDLFFFDNALVESAELDLWKSWKGKSK